MHGRSGLPCTFYRAPPSTESSPRKDAHENYFWHADLFWHADCCKGIPLTPLAAVFNLICRMTGDPGMQRRSLLVYTLTFSLAWPMMRQLMAPLLGQCCPLGRRP